MSKFESQRRSEFAEAVRINALGKEKWMAKFYCQCCGRELDHANKVELELDQRIGEYHDFGGVPESLSQGWFDFGPDCAKKARTKAHKALLGRITKSESPCIKPDCLDDKGKCDIYHCPHNPAREKRMNKGAA